MHLFLFLVRTFHQYIKAELIGDVFIPIGNFEEFLIFFNFLKYSVRVSGDLIDPTNTSKADNFSTTNTIITKYKILYYTLHSHTSSYGIFYQINITKFIFKPKERFVLV